MMNAFFIFDFKNIYKSWLTYIIAFVLLGFGVFTGNQFNMSIVDGIFLNSAYTIGFMIGMLSLSVIFFANIFASQMLFKDWDSKFDNLVFTFPFSKNTYLKGKFFTFFLQTFLSFVLLILGFAIGQNLRTGMEIQPIFNLNFYLYPLLVFGLLNTFFVCSFLFWITYFTQKKLLVVVGGLLLYVLYMVVLLFSSSPFMSGSLPQSLASQQISAVLDPFGLSAYFFEAKDLSVHQKNTELVPFSDFLMVNRLLMIVLSIGFLGLTFWKFSFSKTSHQKTKKTKEQLIVAKIITINEFSIAKSKFDVSTSLESVISFAKIDLIYLFKGIVIVAVSIMLLFFVGMEMYAEIEKGIRLPQKYASSGLMATTISENFHLFGMLIVVYFVNDLYWRSSVSGFSLIENSTFFSKNKLIGHFVSISILVLFFSVLLIVEGLIFQDFYQYFKIDWKAYSGVFLFNTLPIILFAGLALLINSNVRNRYLALGISIVALIVFATPISKKLISNPLFRIFSDFKGNYSDFNGYGIYTNAFFQRLVFGFGIIVFLWFLTEFFKTRNLNFRKLSFTIFIVIISVFSGKLFLKGYQAKDDNQQNLESANYEKQFRKYENLPQPTITDVTTEIHLFPTENSYQIFGKYRIFNQSNQAIQRVLINFHPDLKIESAILKTNSETQKIVNSIGEIHLKKTLKPNEEASLEFKISYKWFASNGHDSFNAIIENGSFMRISRYFPSLGYQKDFEIEDEQTRKEFQLGKARTLKKLDAPEVFKNDFINLKMIVSTDKTQTAIGTGDLIKKWTKNNRNYFEYQAEKIPFRIAVSAAKYQVKSSIHNGIPINIFYNENHSENVDALLKNIKLTLDYCTQNFGKYPFKTVNFAEVSSFTKGFAATAYPSTIFMTENMVFHANIKADQQQDVINELAGHELSHIWWGNSQINPDEREGETMLTETLAMYTEMMLYKKMHGKAKMLERLKVHEEIYNSEKGLSENTPLYKVKPDQTHISYSKGAIAMVKLSEIIGEKNVNLALRNLLNNNQYPKKPTTQDLLNEFYKVAPKQKKITNYILKR